MPRVVPWSAPRTKADGGAHGYSNGNADPESHCHAGADTNADPASHSHAGADTNAGTATLAPAARRPGSRTAGRCGNRIERGRQCSPDTPLAAGLDGRYADVGDGDYRGRYDDAVSRGLAVIYILARRRGEERGGGLRGREFRPPDQRRETEGAAAQRRRCRRKPRDSRVGTVAFPLGRLVGRVGPASPAAGA